MTALTDSPAVTRPLTVLEINNRYRDAGGEHRVVETTRAMLRRRGHRVIVLNEDSRRIQTGRDRLAAAIAGVYSPAAKRRVGAVCERTRPDVVHVHNVYPLLSPSVVVAAADAKLPIVMTIHNYGLTCPIRTHFTHGGPCRRCAARGEHWCVLRNCRGHLLESMAYAARAWAARSRGWIRDRVTLFAAVSRTVAAYLREARIPSARIAVVPNAVAVPPTAADPARGHYALYVGRLSVEKGVDTLAAALARTDPALRLHVVGTGPDEARWRTTPRVTWHGALPPEAVASMYRDARFTIVPSVCEETFGLAAAESMSHAVPVLASRIGGLRELIDDDEDGVLCEPGNAAALAEHMSRLWRDPPLCRRLGEAGRRKIVQRYGEDRCYAHLLQAYERAVELCRDEPSRRST
jgi:glycosyltransferase involved in cell wall biosynthesis